MTNKKYTDKIPKNEWKFQYVKVSEHLTRIYKYRQKQKQTN